MPARVTRTSVEVLDQDNEATARVTRLSTEVLEQDVVATARVTRLSVEILEEVVTPGLTGNTGWGIPMRVV